MMEDDNRVYYRVRGQWKAADPGVPLEVTPPDGWPLLDDMLKRNAEFIVWRGKLLKDRWNKFDRAEFLEGTRELRG